jgi:hypothetical protein
MPDVPKKFRLSNLAGVLTELKRVYRLAHQGEMSWQDAGCAARLLREIRVTIEGGEIEARLAALERAVSEDPDWRASETGRATHARH